MYSDVYLSQLVVRVRGYVRGVVVRVCGYVRLQRTSALRALPLRPGGRYVSGRRGRRARGEHLGI